MPPATSRMSPTAAPWSPVYARWRRPGPACSAAPPAGRHAVAAEPYATPEDFAADLDTVAASLTENGDADLARGPAARSARGGGGFGFHLATMDVRQNSDVHERAVAELLKVAGAADDYLALDEEGRTALLLGELAHARPLRSPL